MTARLRINRERLNWVMMAVSLLSLALSLALVLKGDTASFYLRYVAYFTSIVLMVLMVVFLLVEIGDPPGQTSR